MRALQYLSPHGDVTKQSSVFWWIKSMWGKKLDWFLNIFHLQYLSADLILFVNLSACFWTILFTNGHAHSHTHKPIYMYNYTYVYIYTYKHITHIHTYVRTYILCIHPFLCVNIANDYMPCTAAWSAARQLSVRLSGDPMAPEGSDMTPSGLQQLLETRRYRGIWLL